MKRDKCNKKLARYLAASELNMGENVVSVKDPPDNVEFRMFLLGGSKQPGRGG
jgi:hypothetical protein